MTYRIFRFLLVLLLISSCQDEKKTTELPLRFEKESIIKKAGENCDSADYDCTIISLELLRAKGPAKVSEKINRKLQEHAISTISSEENPQITDLEELTNSFISEYSRAAKDFTQEPTWEAYLNESLYSKDTNFVSIGITTEIFTGGAHGYKSLHFLNFDPQTGETLFWKDIFKPEFKHHVEKLFRKEHDIPADANINSTGFWFENDTFHLPANIGFTDEHVIIVYNSYEIAPYAAGDFYMEIPLEDVQTFRRNR